MVENVAHESDNNPTTHAPFGSGTDRFMAAAEPPSVVGEWTAPAPFLPPASLPAAPGAAPFVAVHATLMPNGKLLMWSHEGRDIYFDGDSSGATDNGLVWDPRTDVWQRVPTGVNLFCAGQTLLADGRVLVAGGHGGYPSQGRAVGLPDAHLFDPVSNAWTALPKMNDGRWYPTTLTLANGDVLVVDGLDAGGIAHNVLPQVYQVATGTWRDLTSALLTRYQHVYPWTFVAPDGRVFFAGPWQDTLFLDTTGKGKLTEGPRSSRSRRQIGCAVMYEPGKILLAGGTSDIFDPPENVTNQAEAIDLRPLTSSGPEAQEAAWRAVAPMAFRRVHFDATLLPDGTVFVSGGTEVPDPGTATLTSLGSAVYATENWDPKTEQWTTWAPIAVPRMYHSIAILLPDARVLTAGGGLPGLSGEPLDTAHQDMQIFSPPYLFRGPRPVIVSAPARVAYGERFSVETPDTIEQVSWVRLGAVTHSVNFNQRFGWVEFTAREGAIDVDAPTSRNDFPPGHYLMFILRKGVPSLGHIIQIGT